MIDAHHAAGYKDAHFCRVVFVGVVCEGDGEQVGSALAVQFPDAHPVSQGVDAVRRVPGRVGDGDLDVPRIALGVLFADLHDPRLKGDIMFPVHDLHQLAGHEVVPAKAGQPVQVYRFCCIG